MKASDTDQERTTPAGTSGDADTAAGAGRLRSGTGAVVKEKFAKCAGAKSRALTPIPPAATPRLSSSITSSGCAVPPR